VTRCFCYRLLCIYTPDCNALLFPVHLHCKEADPLPTHQLNTSGRPFFFSSSKFTVLIEERATSQSSFTAPPSTTSLQIFKKELPHCFYSGRYLYDHHIPWKLCSIDALT
uniref:Uncharacterized protein n=1 Tax=Astyanax mexicanus TaxID=7994 RepID=A0A8B9JJV7_ASTMX